MSTYSNEHFFIGQPEGEDIEMYLNGEDEIFVHKANDECELYSWFFTISAEDWIEMRAFIDRQFGFDNDLSK